MYTINVNRVRTGSVMKVLECMNPVFRIPFNVLIFLLHIDGGFLLIWSGRKLK